MKMTVDLDWVVVERPIRDVFAFLSDMENSPLWGRTVTTTKLSAGSPTVGTQFREVALGDGGNRDKETVITELDAPTRFAYTSRYANGMVERARVTFEEVTGGTRIQPKADVEIPGVPQDQEPALSAEMKEAVKALLDNLRRVLEAES
jgi:uncharacterized protein YndB with AHSA1/START domain